MAEVCKQGDNSLSCTTILIAFVPGVMGTRLHFDSGSDWDPDDNGYFGAMSHWYKATPDDERAELKYDRHATVMTVNPDQTIKLTGDEIARGYGSVVWSYYGPFLRFLNAVNYPTLTPVYAFGYDWRQSNSQSGKDLASRINQTADSQQADGVIIVSHSMGGLATRSALQQDSNLNARLLGIIHVFQPASGAVVLYRRFYSGMVAGVDGEKAECVVFGNTADKFATIISGLNGPIELLPTCNYVDGADPRWLSCTYNGAPTSFDSKSIFNVYRMTRAESLTRCTDKPPALGGPTTRTVVVPTELALRVDSAKAFHDGLGLYKHPNTFAIFGTGRSTDVRFLQSSDDINQFRDTPQRRDEGDGTVPASSASVLFPGQAFALADICKEAARQFIVYGVSHSGAFNNGDVRTLVNKLILRVLGVLCLNPPSPTGDYNPIDSGQLLASNENYEEAKVNDNDEPGANNPGDSTGDGWQNDDSSGSEVAEEQADDDSTDSDSSIA